MRLVKLAILLGLLAWAGTARAQETLDPKAWAEGFFDTLTQKGVDEAHAILLNNSQIGKSRPDAIRGIRENMRQAEQFYGAAAGYEFVGERDVGSSMKILVAIVKRRELPMLWRLVFYRYDQTWNLVHFQFVDQYEGIDAFWAL